MKTNLILLGLLYLFLSCTENVTNHVDVDFPDKLSPYETFFDKDEFAQRRNNLIQNLPDNALAIIATNESYLRNGDVEYEFRPASGFFYLTGFDEPNAIAVIRKNQNNLNDSELIMFVENREGTVVKWLGPVYGTQGAVDYFGADSAYEYHQFACRIKSYLNSGIYQSVYGSLETNQAAADSFYSAVGSDFHVEDISAIIGSARNIKSQMEIDVIQKAVDVSVQAFKEAMENIKPGMYEYEAEAVFDYITAANGCDRTAYPSIVASGPNINILHYGANDRQMEDGDLVMIDFGAEYWYYASDITRTLPVNGKFTEKQKTVYNIVLEAHKAAIEGAVPGVDFNILYSQTVEMILDKLLEKGIVYGDKDELLNTYAFRGFIVAGLGHTIGLDVHDPFPAGANHEKILHENMVLAFEPHVYFYENDPLVNPDYWDISVRIEDDVLITSDGSVILSSDLPMDADEIERMMK